MQITRDEARRIAALAHLEFDDAGLDRMAAEMTAILTYIDQLKEVEGIAAEERGATPMRDDEVRSGVAREDVERNAPAWHDGQFIVPKVIE
jgi:aspartyl-tRNA(Asn)/glutamyl-tRNA(Gln) amidotransferase subunit C